MDRRWFMKALAASLGVFGLDKLVKAEEKIVEEEVTFDPTKFRYYKFFRRADEAAMDEFRNIVVLDESGKLYKVPIIWADNDRTEAYVKTPQEIDSKTTRLNLPVLNLFRGDLFFGDKIYVYYHLTARTIYEEDMNQILEQVVTKFHPKFKNAAGEYSLLSIINNMYPGGSNACIIARGDRAMRVDVMSAAQHGKMGQWILCETNGIRVLRQEFNMIVALDGKP